MAILYKSFEIHGKKYIYDTATNSIIALTDDPYRSLGVEEESVSVLQQLQEKGYCKDITVETLEHPQSRVLPSLLERRTEKMTLQVTQQCNLRCKYCAYSGYYDNRKHANKKMSLETAKKGIDYLMARSIDASAVDIGFYGGEPLLEFDLVEECINYCATVYPGKKCTYTMTTNGTLLTLETYKKLRDYKFNLLISLDGPKEVHDMSRVFANGKGSFDTIMRNVQNIIEHFPEDKGKIQFNAVVSPEVSERCADTLFGLNEVSEYYNITLGFMSDMSTDEKPKFSDNFRIMYEQEMCKLFLHMLGKLPDSAVSRMILNSKGSIDNAYKKLGKFRMTSSCHPGGPCLAGVGRLFITVDGEFFPCERISETSKIMCIGNIDQGVDADKAIRFMNPAFDTEVQCKKCWSFTLCSSCAGRSDGETEYSAKRRLSQCESVRMSTLEQLKDICFLKQHGYKFGKELRNFINELGEKI